MSQRGTVSASRQSPPFRLSKSRYVRGVRCLKSLYFYTHNRDLAEPHGAEVQLLFHEGRVAGEKAREYFPGGTLITESYLESEKALESTRRAIANGAKTLFEAAFQYNDVLVRADVIEKQPDGSWKLIEVKGTTEIKDEHLPDLAIQYYVISHCGFKMSSANLMYINNQCVYSDLSNLFTICDQTEEIKPHVSAIENNLASQRASLSKTTAPETDIGLYCLKPHKCEFKKHCWQHIPEHSVFELYNLTYKKKFKLHEDGTTEIKQILIRKGDKYSEHQLRQIKTVQSGETFVDENGLRDFLNSFTYPIYYLDFETYAPPIPRFDGIHAFGRYPFQYSCHVRTEDGNLTHSDYLCTDNRDPRPEIIRSFLTVLGTTGTILAYHAAFEKGVIEELAGQFPEYGPQLQAILGRILDLKDGFKDFVYHPAFHGSFSIKKVLPALVPDMTYENMEVGEGREAELAFLKMTDPTTPADEKKKIAQNLIIYCTQDTMAMVKLHDILLTLLKR